MEGLGMRFCFYTMHKINGRLWSLGMRLQCLGMRLQLHVICHIHIHVHIYGIGGGADLLRIRLCSNVL